MRTGQCAAGLTPSSCTFLAPERFGPLPFAAREVSEPRRIRPIYGS